MGVKATLQHFKMDGTIRRRRVIAIGKAPPVCKRTNKACCKLFGNNFNLSLEGLPTYIKLYLFDLYVH